MLSPAIHAMRRPAAYTPYDVPFETIPSIRQILQLSVANDQVYEFFYNDTQDELLCTLPSYIPENSCTIRFNHAALTLREALAILCVQYNHYEITFSDEPSMHITLDSAIRDIPLSQINIDNI